MTEMHRYSIIVYLTSCFLLANTQYGIYQVTLIEIQRMHTHIEQFPIIAQLLKYQDCQQYVQHCAGVILTEFHVLSAAHCFHNPQTGIDFKHPQYWKIRVGSTYRSSGGVIHNVERIILHGSFNDNFKTNDIAILVVSEMFTFNRNVRKGTFLTEGGEIPFGSPCTMVGWGALQANGPQTEQLKFTNLVTECQFKCAETYERINAVIQDSMMCAVRMDGRGSDGCFGDSGGPLIHKGVVVGIVSFGYSCGSPIFPTVFTKVSHHTEWIVRTINNT